MDVITLRLSESLDAALLAATKKCGLSKSADVREALEQALGSHESRAGGAARWAVQWRGRLALPAKSAHDSGDDARFAHLLAKQLR